MSLWNTIGFILTLAFFVFIMIYLNKGKTEKIERTQDLIRFKKISDDGIIELPDGVYRCMLEVEPVNLYLKTLEEQKVIWNQFREMIGALHVPVTIMVQSRHKDIKKYVQNLKEKSEALSPELKAYGYDLADYLNAEISEKKVKEHRYYLLLEVNPNERRSELEIPSEALANIVSSFQKGLSPQEAEDLARQELQDAVGIIASYLKNMGLNVYYMDKNAVLEMAYSALNRDLAPVADFETIVRSSSIHAVSLTREIIDSEVKHNEAEEESPKAEAAV